MRVWVVLGERPDGGGEWLAGVGKTRQAALNIAAEDAELHQQDGERVLIDGDTWGANWEGVIRQPVSANVDIPPEALTLADWDLMYTFLHAEVRSA